MKIWYLTVIFAFLSFGSVLAEGEEEKEASGPKKKKNFLKFNVSSLMVGDLSLHYEYYFGTQTSFEIGAGYQLPYYPNFNFNINRDLAEFINTDLDMGYSITTQFRYYLTDRPEYHSYPGFYVAAMARYRYFATTPSGINASPASGDFNIVDTYGLLGLQSVFHRRSKFFYDLSLGLGMQFIADENLPDRLAVGRVWALSANIRLGYLF